MKATSKKEIATGFPIAFATEKIPLWMICLTKIIKTCILLFHWFFKKKDNENEIIKACNCLDVGEFQLFQLAYRDWFGMEAGDKKLVKCFSIYLTHNQAPFWVHHYARKILKLSQSNELNQIDAEYHQFDCEYKSPVSRETGVMIVFAVLLIIVAFDFFLIFI